VKRRLGEAAAAIVVAACLTTSVARADPTDDQVRAQALFEEAKALRGARRITAACADFEESRRLDEGIGVTLYLADCYEHAGDLRRAATDFRRAEALAAARGDKRAAVARRRAEVLEALSPRRTRSTAAPAADPAPSAAQRDDASAPGDDAVARSNMTRRWVGIGVAGAGVIGIGIGAVFGAVALSKLSQSNDGPCDPDNRCTPAGLELRRQSGSATTGATISFAAGAAALAAGIGIYLTTPRDGEMLTVAPTVTAGGGGALLAFRF
jgi:hypothetical protein